jgi:hypothetical protein
MPLRLAAPRSRRRTVRAPPGGSLAPGDPGGSGTHARRWRQTTSAEIRIASDSPFCESRRSLKKLEHNLISDEAMHAPLHENRADDAYGQSRADAGDHNITIGPFVRSRRRAPDAASSSTNPAPTLPLAARHRPGPGHPRIQSRPVQSQPPALSPRHLHAGDLDHLGPQRLRHRDPSDRHAARAAAPAGRESGPLELVCAWAASIGRLRGRARQLTQACRKDTLRLMTVPLALIACLYYRPGISEAYARSRAAPHRRKPATRYTHDLRRRTALDLPADSTSSPGEGYPAGSSAYAYTIPRLRRG